MPLDPPLPLRPQTGSARRSAARTGLATALVAALLVLGPATAALAGSEGPGISTPPGPTNAELAAFLMNEPGEPVPSYVCVDDPATACFDLDATNVSLAPRTLISSDCPAGPAAQACRPDEIAGTEVTGTLALAGLPSAQWVRTDVSHLHPYNGCEFGGNHATQNISPATLDTANDPGIGSEVYVDSVSFKLQALPTELGCAQWIRTEVAAAGSTAPVEVSFTTGRYGYVYVAYDSTATKLPAWLLADYVAIRQTVTVRVANILDVPFDLYRSPGLVDIGTAIEIPGNRADGGTAGRNYLTFVRPPSATEYCGSWTGTVSIDTPAGPVTTQTIGEAGCGIIDESSVTIEPPILIPGGLGWYTGGQLLCTADLNSGEELEYERAFGVTGQFDRGAFVDAAQDADPVLCNPDSAGDCQDRPAMTLVGLNGVMEAGTPTANPEVCTFTARFTPPGQTRMVADGPAVNDVDNGISTVIAASATGAGVIDDVDVYVQTSFVFADNLNIEVHKGAGGAFLDTRSCSTFFSPHDVWFDDEAATPNQAACGSVIGRTQPKTSLDFADDLMADGDYDLWIRDPVAPGHGTDLLAYQVRIETRHTECSDDIDNDGDGFVDFDGNGVGMADINCISAADNKESPNAGGGTSCGLGPELAPALFGLVALRRGRRRSD